MSANGIYLAVYTGSASHPRRDAWNALSDDERRAKAQEGIAAWGAWMDRHSGAVVYAGGPLGKTKRISPDGVTDVANELAGFLVFRAPSHEAAAAMFEGHPHFSVFPGEGVDVMPVLPVPGA